MPVCIYGVSKYLEGQWPIIDGVCRYLEGQWPTIEGYFQSIVDYFAV